MVTTQTKTHDPSKFSTLYDINNSQLSIATDKLKPVNIRPIGRNVNLKTLQQSPA